MQEADKYFAKTTKGMNSRHGSWPSNSVRKELRDEMREFASERLQLVQVGDVYRKVMCGLMGKVCTMTADVSGGC